MGACAEKRNVLVDILLVAALVAIELKTQGVNPQRAQSILVEAADGDLLNAESFEGSVCHAPLIRVSNEYPAAARPRPSPAFGRR